MRCAIVGSRCFDEKYYNIIKAHLQKFNITEIISGGANGIDSLAEKYAHENNIPTTIFKPNWKKYGKSAGFIRNKDIILNSDIVIAFWDNKSKGTKHSMNLAKKYDKKLYVYIIY